MVYDSGPDGINLGARLTDLEIDVIRLRYGLGDGYRYDQDEVGRIFKLRKDMVRDIENSALRKLPDDFRIEVLLEGRVD
jgi:RNA polymerase primary sigma factor